jgi:transcriptional regulator with XRE-family HTH domain
MSISGSQIRAARAFLQWSVADLAKRARVGLSTIQRIEDVNGSAAIAGNLQWRIDARAQAVAKIQAAFEGAGITFLTDNGQGVGLRGQISPL